MIDALRLTLGGTIALILGMTSAVFTARGLAPHLPEGARGLALLLAVATATGGISTAVLALA